jgi:two-component system OmpR family sensor kinase
MRRWWPWLAAMAPAVLGLGLALLLQSGRLPDPVLYLQADLGTILLLAGLIFSGGAAGAVALLLRAHRRLTQAVSEEREEAAEAHRRFVRRLDHELKNPLTAMRIGLANLAGTSPRPEQREVLASLETQAERLGRLVTDLRKLIELEVRPLEREPVKVGELLEEVVELARQQSAAAERHLSLSVPQAPWPLPPVSGDRDLLFLAIYNLLDNALKFTRDDDRLEIRAFEDGTTIVVEVADTGPGVPDEELPHIFEELYRGQEARGIEGSGLGLALVKAVVEQHGGRAAVRSRPGQGTVFTLRLPASS